ASLSSILLPRPPPIFPLFPYTTLFRSGVFVANRGQGLATVVHAYKGNDEFISHSLVIRFLRALNRVHVLGGFAIAMDHGIEGFRDALPAPVAVHGVVPAIDGRDFAGVVLAHLLLKLLEIPGSGRRQRVSAIHESVDENT